MSIKHQWATIVAHEIEQEYALDFFKTYLTNYIADHNPAFAETMTFEQFVNYLQLKNKEAMREFCLAIRRGATEQTAIAKALHVLLFDVNDDD